MGSDLQGPCSTDGARQLPVCPASGTAPRHLGMMLCCLPAGPSQRSPSTPASCRFSCEELQGIDLELNVDNSAFYDQFAIAQVGRAARVGGAAQGRGFLGRQGCPGGWGFPGGRGCRGTREGTTLC